MLENKFAGGTLPKPRWGASTLFPRPLVAIKRPTSNGRGGEWEAFPKQKFTNIKYSSA